LPTPSGPFKIGLKVFYINDKNRTESHTFTDSQRKLLIQIFYPSVLDTTKKSWSYLAETVAALKDTLEKTYYIPRFILNLLFDLPTHTQSDTPIATKQAPYPLLIFSHGFGALGTSYLAFIEEIVSHGYIVAAINHTYAAGLVPFPDGKVIWFNQETTLADDAKSYDELNIWVQDIQFTLDEVTKINQSDMRLGGRINMESIGTLGHSFGGIAALVACREDNRIKVAVNMDGSLGFDKNSKTSIDKPLMLLLQDYERPSFLAKRLVGRNLSKEEYIETKFATFTDLCKSNNAPTYLLSFKKASHDSFSDGILLKQPLKFLFGADTGEREPYLFLKIVNQYLVDFFDTHLKNKKANLLDSVSKCSINRI